MSYWLDGSGKTVGVLGLGRSGRAAAALLSQRGFAVVGIDDSPDCSPCPDCLRHVLGDTNALDLEELDGLVLSPGVPPAAHLPSRARELGIPVTGEVELASLFTSATVAAVTGSNGKTTTVEWLGHLLRNAGLNACVAGNMGYPFSRAVLERPDAGVYVLEVSSYQLETIRTFRPKVAAVLNLTPDHLSRHGDMDGYRSAKARIFMNQSPEDFLVLNADDPQLVSLMGLTEGLEMYFSLRRPVETGAFLREGGIRLAWDGGVSPLLPVEELSLPGAHNTANALAVASMARALGVSGRRMLEGLRTFPGVPHRLEEIRRLAGVRYVNDSKSTNIDSLRVALEAEPGPLVLIAGGRPKEGDYGGLREAVRSRVRAVLTIGEAAGMLAEAWSDGITVERLPDLDAAVDRARSLARSGDTVLLSPGCASFDQYENFEERGDHFRSLVEALS